MEFLQELLITVGVYILACVVVPKLVSMAVSGSNGGKRKFVCVSADLMNKRVVNEPNKSMVCVKRVVDEPMVCDDFERVPFVEEVSESLALFNCEIADNERVGGVGLEEESEKESGFDSGGLKEDGLVVVEDGVVENVVEESPERAEVGEVGMELVKDEVGGAKIEEVGVLESEGTIGTEIEDGVGKIDMEMVNNEVCVAKHEEGVAKSEGTVGTEVDDGLGKIEMEMVKNEVGVAKYEEGVPRSEGSIGTEIDDGLGKIEMEMVNNEVGVVKSEEGVPRGEGIIGSEIDDGLGKMETEMVKNEVGVAKNEEGVHKSEGTIGAQIDNGLGKIEMEMVKNEVGVAKIEEGVHKSECTIGTQIDDGLGKIEIEMVNNEVGVIKSEEGVPRSEGTIGTEIDDGLGRIEMGMAKNEVGVAKSEEGVPRSEGTIGTDIDDGVGKIEMEMAKNEVGVAKSEEGVPKNEGTIGTEVDDWVGKTEMEMVKNEVGVAKSEGSIGTGIDDGVSRTGMEIAKNEGGVAKNEEGVAKSEGSIGTGIDDEVIRIGLEMINDEVGLSKSDDALDLANGDSKWNGNERDGVSNNVGADEEDGFFDDWEGIERTELEKCFGAAVVFVGSKTNAGCISSIDNDTKMQLYGLHKISTEGPCRVPQPMALKVFARAKWNAWQRLGNMSPEVAMEQYVTLLSGKFPGWLGDGDYGGEQGFSDVKASSNLSTSLQKEPETEKERKLEDMKLLTEERGVNGVESSNSISRDE